MEDPVLLIPSGITYDRKSICGSLFRCPNLCPKTNVRYNTPLDYCDNVDIRDRLSNYVPFDDKEFRRVYQRIQHSWDTRETREMPRIIADQPGTAATTTNLSLSETYRQVHVLAFGMNQRHIDYEAALKLTEAFPTDPVMIAMQASIIDAMREKRSRQTQKLYRQAIKHGIFHVAKDGCPFAQFFVGMFYIGGDAGTKRNLNKGREWIEKAAAQGDPSAQCHLGFLHFHTLPEEDDEQACESFLKAAEQGHALAQFLLGEFYKSYGTATFVSMGREWTEQAALQGYDYAQRHMGLFCEIDMNDPNGAMFWYELAASSGNKDAQFAMANLYRRGRLTGRGRDFQKAKELYAQAATRGHLRATGWLVIVKAGIFVSKKKLRLMQVPRQTSLPTVGVNASNHLFIV